MTTWRYEFVSFVWWWQFSSADYQKIFFQAEVTSSIWAVVRWARWKNVPWDGEVNVVVYESPDVFAEFGGVAVLCRTKWSCMVSVSCLEVIFCQSYTCFSNMIVLACDNPPFSKNVSTNIRRRFLSLVDKHFHKDHKLRKIFYHNTIKICYSCIACPQMLILLRRKNCLE